LGRKTLYCSPSKKLHSSDLFAFTNGDVTESETLQQHTMEKTRRLILEEILSTERVYINDLELIIKVSGRNCHRYEQHLYTGIH
jgi:hypothetical protein